MLFTVPHLQQLLRTSVQPKQFCTTRWCTTFCYLMTLRPAGRHTARHLPRSLCTVHAHRTANSGKSGMHFAPAPSSGLFCADSLATLVYLSLFLHRTSPAKADLLWMHRFISLFISGSHLIPLPLTLYFSFYIEIQFTTCTAVLLDCRSLSRSAPPTKHICIS